MAKWQREQLYSEIRRRVAERPERRIRRHFGTVLHIARRRNRAIPPNPHRSGSIPQTQVETRPTLDHGRGASRASVSPSNAHRQRGSAP
jgi:hypothetical protein